MIMEEGVTIEQIIRRAIEDGLTLEIEYAKNSFEKSTRVISDARLGPNSSKRTSKQLCNYEFDASKPIFNLYGEKFL